MPVSIKHIFQTKGILRKNPESLASPAREALTGAEHHENVFEAEPSLLQPCLAHGKERPEK